MIRKAKVSDGEQIFGLVNHYARQGLMLPKSRSQVYRDICNFVVVEEEGGFLGCGALHVLWEDLGEIRSLAVAEERCGKGLGKAIVTRLLEEARELGLPKVLALTTHQKDFFLEMGFRLVDKEELPRKIWADCINCVKFPNCDAVALMKEI